MKPAFIRNEGQESSEVRFYTDAGSDRLFLTANRAVWTFGLPSAEKLVWAVALQFRGGAVAPLMHTEVQAPGQINLFRGNDPSGWVSGLDRWESVCYLSVWPGIDLAFQAGEQLKYEMRVAPGSDPSQITFALEGVGSFRIDDEGNLILSAPEGEWELIDAKPIAWQVKGEERIPVTASFRLLEGGFGFALPDGYDATLPLVIDPALRPRYSTYLGGSLIDAATAVDAAPDKTDVVVGTTNSPNFPATPGVFQPALNTLTPLAPLTDAFVARFRPNGQLIFATFLGGTLADAGLGVDTDLANNIYVVGSTASTDFPVTPGAFQTTPGGATDAFVTKMNPLGTALIYSTYLGGSAVDAAADVEVDALGQAVVVGTTASPNFPTANAVQPALGPPTDAFVTKFNAAGTALIFSTYLGGTGADSGFGVDLDSAGGAVVVGQTASPNFPATAGLDTTLGGPSDGFVTRYTPAGTAFVYSTYLGGSLADAALDVAVDRSSNAFVTGTTSSADFPVTAGAFDTTLGGIDDAFVARMNPNGTIGAATYLGGSALVSAESGNGIDLHPTGTPVIGGVTTSADFPVTPDAFQPTFRGLTDAFLTWMTFDLSKLIYSTYLGGTGADIGLDVTVHQDPDITIVGTTTSTDFPVVNAFQPALAGLTDGFVTRFFVPLTPGGRGTPPLFVGGVCPPGVV